MTELPGCPKRRTQCSGREHGIRGGDVMDYANPTVQIGGYCFLQNVCGSSGPVKKSDEASFRAPAMG